MITRADEEERMAGTRKSGKGRSAKDAGKSGSSRARSGARSAKPAALAQMDARLQAVFDGSRDAIGVSKAGVHVLVNPAYLALFGFPPDADLAGTPILDLIAPERRDQIKEYVASRARGKQVPAIYETCGLRVDGSAFDMEVSVSLYREDKEDLTLVILRDITGRKMAEQEIAERGATLQQIMDTASVAIFLVNKAGRITHANRRMAEMFGCAMKDLVGSEYVSLVHPSEREIGRGKMLALLASEIPSVDLERHYWRRDGTEFWGHLAGQRYHDVQGSEMGLIGVITDIDKRKQAEQKLRTSEVRWRSLVETSAAWIWETDANIRHTYTNAFVSHCLGYRPDEFLNMDIHSLVHPDDHRVMEEIVQKATEHKEGWADNVLRWRHKDGSWKFIESSGTALFDEGGRFAGLRGIDRDVTERKRDEEKLKESQEKYKFLIETTKTGYVILSGDGLVIDANAEYVRISGHDKLEDILGRSIVEWTAEHDRERNAEEVKKCMNAGFVRNLEIDYVDKNGRFTPVEINATVIRTGDVIRIFTLCRDITERKRADQALWASEERFRILSDASFEAIAITEKGKFLDANKQMCDMIGYTLAELKGMPVVDIIAPEDRELVSHNQSIGYEPPYENRLLHRNGSHVLVESRARHFALQNRKVRVTVLRDITERKRAEEALKKSEKMLQTIIDAEPECVKLLDENANLIMMNRAGLDMLQVESLDQVKGQCVCPMVTSEYRQAFLDLTKRVFQGESGTLLFEMVGMKGRHLWMETHAVPLRNENNEITALLGVTRDVTERKRAEEELQEKESKYRTLFEAANDGIFIQDGSGFRDCNQRGAEMYGLPKEQLIGRSPAEFAPERQPDGRLSAEVAGERTQAALNGVPQVFEWQPLRADGSLFDVEVTLSRLELGGSICLQAIVRDITERKRVEAETRRNETRMASLYRISQNSVDDEQVFLDLALNEAIRLTDSTIGYLYFYDEAKREFTLNSYSRDVMRECSIIEKKTCYELDRTGIWGEAVRQRKPILLNDFESEHPLKKGYPEGHARLRKFLTVPVIMEGVVVAVIGVANKPMDYSDADVLQLNLLMDSVWNMTRRARAVRAMLSSEARYRTIIEHASSGILVADIETRKFLYANPEICRMLGFDADEFRLLDLSDIHPAAELPQVIRSFAAGKGIQTLCRHKNGRVFPVDIKTAELELDGRKCLVGFFSDITEKRLLEEERLKAQKLESLGTLAGGIAHDFNNLLQGVFGYISMAKLTIEQREKSLAMLEQAEKALHQSVNLTSQLLTFSKGGKPVKKVLDLRPVVENAVKFALSGSRVGYDLSFAADLSMVEADDGQIGQVVQNIVLNAEQSMPLGGKLEISVRNVPPAVAAGLQLAAPSGLVEIVVRDQGTGIPPEHLPRIFDPYFTTKEKGSGLGLATSYSIVKNHDGMIGVSSELGKGSVFTVYLPATRAAQDTAASSSSTGACATGRTCRVLVMDDEEIVRVVAGELLRELGHEAEFAEHGDAAIMKYRRAKAEGRPFDVVILDLTVRGGMGGLETLRKLMEIDPGVKAVVSSGYSDDEVVATYRQHGFYSFLKKPYDMQELARMLDDALA